MAHPVSYEEVRERLGTGDIVLFSGKGRISQIIKWFSGTEYSHVAMVVHAVDQDAVFLWESTTLSNVADVETGTYRKGVQLVPLSDRLERYEGTVWVRHLAPALSAGQRAALWQFRREVAGRPYERKKVELFLSLFKDRGIGGCRRQEDLSSLFCSELVAEAYQRMGLLPDVDQGGLPSDRYTPDLFAEGHSPQLLAGHHLGAQLEVRYVAR